MSTLFVDISTVRIHGYLERTPRLRLIRGASALLAEATEPVAVAAAAGRRFPSGCVRVCDDAGRSESIIHLEVECRCGTCQAADVARWGVRWLRSQVPAADLRAVWGTGDTYSEFAVSAGDESLSTGRFDSPAPDQDLVMLAVCESCRRGYAGPGGFCVDCRQRHDAADRRVALSPERQLLDRLGATKGRDVNDFRDLAALGPTDRIGQATTSRKTNHLATVYIDGNGFRAMFAGAGRYSSSHGFDVNALSRGVGSAVWGALEAAVHNVWEHHRLLRPDVADQVPVIPHIVAADDLCVSLPAAYGWRFVVGYCAAFEQLAKQVVADAGAAWRPSSGRNQDEVFEMVPPPTASAGIVIAHESEPFSTCLDAAEVLLKQAKRYVDGRLPSAMWVDVSRDGLTPPDTRQPVLLRGLSESVLAELASLPQSRRRNLEQDAAIGGRDGRARVLDRARRLHLMNRAEYPALADAVRSLDVAEFGSWVNLAEWWT